MRIFTPHPLPHIAPDNAGYAHMCEKLMERLADVSRKDFAHALWVSPVPAPDLGKSIGTLVQTDTLTLGDIDYFAHAPESFDLIIVCGLLDNVNDLPGALIQIRKALKPDGLFLAAFTGGESLRELRECLSLAESELHGGVSARVHPVVDLVGWAGLLQRAGFALPVADSDIVVVHYTQLNTLLRDLKGAGGMRLAQRNKHFVGKEFWGAVQNIYRERFGDNDGLLPASFEVLYGIGWAPADTQQKPLKPGSAKTRLADALGTNETPLPR